MLRLLLFLAQVHIAYIGAFYESAKMFMENPELDPFRNNLLAS